MATSIRELEGTWEEVRAHDAELAGHRVRLVVLTESEHPPLTLVPTAEELMRMPEEERARVLEQAAAVAAPLYETDMAKPPQERELTAFTALDGEDFVDLD